MSVKRMGEADFLEQYREEDYEKLSLTVDILVFSMDRDFCLEILLKKRKTHPYKGCWALPGGFVGVGESLEEAAVRVLKDKTGLSDLHMEQLYTFGEVKRDPRMRIVSVAYLVLLPRESLLEIERDSSFFKLSYKEPCLKDAALKDPSLKNAVLRFTAAGDLGDEGPSLGDEGPSFGEEELAFDHAEMIALAIERMRGKLHYTDIGLQFLRDRGSFTLYELQKIYEAIEAKTYDIANFRRYFRGRYEDSGAAEKTGEVSTEFSKRPSSYYRIKEVR